MMDKRDYVILWLTVQVTIMSYLYCKILAKEEYQRGILDTYAQFTKGPDEEIGTCLAGKGVRC